MARDGPPRGSSKPGKRPLEASDSEAMMRDARFKDVAFDPKFARKPKDKTKVKVDKRFQSMFTDEAFTESKVKVDKYGRKLSKKERAQGHDLKRLYDVQSGDEDQSDEDNDKAPRGASAKGKVTAAKATKPAGKGDSKEDRLEYLNKLARGEIKMRDSSDESDAESESSESEAETRKPAPKSTKAPKTKKAGAAAAKTNAENAEDAEAEEEEEEEEDQVPLGEATRRIAVQNLDWARLTANDIFAVMNSFVTGGALKSVKVYQSIFGEQRLQEEERFGPRIGRPEEMSSKGGSDAAADDEEEDESSDEDIVFNQDAGEGDGYNDEALRRYELDKLKYYFAIAEFDSVTAASKVYDECDGVEFERSSNVFDLRFVPDDVELDRPLRDEATGFSEDYEAPEFVTQALQSTKVDLTWDEDDHNRQKLNQWKNGDQVKGKRMIGERDLEAFIASDVESESDSESEDEERRKRKSAEYRKTLRAALLGEGGAAGGLRGEASEAGEDDEDAVFQMTYDPELEERLQNRASGQTAEDAAKPKKSKRRARDEVAAAEEEALRSEAGADKKGKKGADPFNDPFFTNPEGESRKDQKRKERARRQNGSGSHGDEQGDGAKVDPKVAAEARREKEAAELELLLLDEKNRKKGGGLEGFDFKTLVAGEKILLEKGGKVKGRAKKKQKIRDALELAKSDTFKVDTTDQRFAPLYEDPDYSVDRTSAQYKTTRGMLDLEKEALKRRGEHKQHRGPARREGGSSGGPSSDGEDIETMLSSVKRKAQMFAAKPDKSRKFAKNSGGSSRP